MPKTERLKLYPTQQPLRAVIWCAVSTKEQAAEDKDSLDAQERDSRALAEREAMRVIEVLRVPGHSRRYVDIYECARDMAGHGLNAFNRLLQLWETKAFDVLVCRDADRFARTQTLHSYVVERTIEIGARIYSLNDGWIDESNYRMWIAMGGYKAASHIDGLVKARQMGMAKRMERGLNGGTGIPLTHRTIRAENGKALRLELREEMRRTMDDAAELLLDGVGWKAFAIELYNRYGHVNPETNKPYHDNMFYRLFHNPIAWGFAAKGYKYKYGLWAFDENEPLPPGVIVNRHPNPPIPPVWTGETAELIKAELRRRAIVVKGRARSNGQYKFTGLLVCSSCGRRMAIETASSKRPHIYWRCSSHTYRHYKLGQVCENRLLLRDTKAEEQIDAFLERLLLLKRPDWSALSSTDDADARNRARLVQLECDIVSLKAEINTLITRQAKAPDNVQELYAEQITEASQRLTILHSDLQRTAIEVEPLSVSQARQLAYETLVEMGLDDFWQLPPHEINQTLHRLMGRYRFVVQNGSIIDVRRLTR